MPKVKVNGIDIHYIAVGQGSDMVMVHGFLGNLAVWHLQIVPQLRNSYSITTPDLRGHGYSQVTPSGYTAADMANDLKGLLDTLGLRKVALVGHSYGGMVVTGVAVSGFSLGEIAVKHPQQLAQATPPLQGSPAPAASDKPAESKPGGTRPTTPAPEPATPTTEAQKEGAKAALPTAPPEKMAPPIEQK